MKNFNKFGRKIVVDGIVWRWRTGMGGNVVARTLCGKRKHGTAYEIKGWSDPSVWERGQWKKTSDGMLYPSDIAKWLKQTN